MKRVVMFSLLLMLAVPAMSQSEVSRHDSPEWWENVSKQNIKLLESPITGMRAQALKNSIYLSKFHAEQISFDAAVRPIIRVYERDTDPTVRKLALAALESIGSNRARNYIATHVPGEKAQETHELIAAVLNEYTDTL